MPSRETSNPVFTPRWRCVSLAVFAAMSKSNETPSTPTGDDRNLVTAAESVAAPDLEEKVRLFLEKNRSAIIAVALVVIVAILGRHGLQWMEAGKITAEREAFAAVSTDEERKAFAAEHSDSLLGGVALLQIADNAYSEGRFDDAISGYAAAADAVGDNVLAGRIGLGRAMSQIKSGDTAGGQSGLRTIADDLAAPRAVRTEAAYHLATIASGNGDAEGLAKLVTQINAIDPASSWAQRVSILQAALPVAAGSADVSFGTP
jgi:hypothetical protein